MVNYPQDDNDFVPLHDFETSYFPPDLPDLVTDDDDTTDSESDCPSVGDQSDSELESDDDDSIPVDKIEFAEGELDWTTILAEHELDWTNKIEFTAEDHVEFLSMIPLLSRNSAYKTHYDYERNYDDGGKGNANDHGCMGPFEETWPDVYGIKLAPYKVTQFPLEGAEGQNVSCEDEPTLLPN